MPGDAGLPRIAVFASGAGTTFAALLDAQSVLQARIVLLVSNLSRCGAMQIAQARGVARLHLSAATHPEAPALDAAMADALDAHTVDVVVLAGYLKRLGPRTLARYAGRIYNTHPSLLPRHGGAGMYGDHVHAAVLAAGDTESGATVHRVDGDYDTGPVVAQVRVPVLAGDSVATLAERVRHAEKALLIATLRDVLAGGAPARR
jgi:phosphoribosylglycinamide formyltransferase-1